MKYQPRPEFIQNLNGPAKHAACAHFPGGGPAGATCLDCKFFHQTLASRRKKKGRCMEWGRLRHVLIHLQQLARHWWDGWPTIPESTPACRYFDPKEPSP